ncbi:MAG: hypothetical protein EOO51_13265 [Flavobacterium sp.]|nr:MAG: hypothetical protein EOO51_13265 [Flavobacterium sp.]
MNYSVTSLTTTADCDVLLSMAAKEKADLNFKQLSAERLTARFTQTSQDIAADLQGVLAEISATETIISVLPEGPSKEDALDKLTRLQYKKFLLETRMESYGTVAWLEKEMDLGRIIMELQEVDIFTAAVEARKDELA